MTKYVRADMPVHHFADHSKDFVTLKARERYEIDRRRQLQPGSLKLEKQSKGLLISRYIVEQLTGDDLSEGLHVVGKSLFGSAYYSSARGASDVMRRNLDVPSMFDKDTGLYLDYSTALATALAGLASCQRLADRQYWAHERRDPQRLRFELQLGRALGNTAMRFACVDLASSVSGLSPRDAQEVARSECLTMMQRTAADGIRIGSNPSLAQLAEPLSPWALDIRLNSDSSELVRVYEAALDGGYIEG